MLPDFGTPLNRLIFDPNDPKWEVNRQKKDQAGWNKKGFKRANPSAGLPLGGGRKGKAGPSGGKRELAANDPWASERKLPTLPQDLKEEDAGTDDTGGVEPVFGDDTATLQRPEGTETPGDMDFPSE
jgi:hypothetical protein